MNTITNTIDAIFGAFGGMSMLKFLIRRTLAAIPVVFAIAVVTFGLSQALPGGPFDAANQRRMPENIRAQLEQRYGLDKSVFFNGPNDGKGSDTTWGGQSYAKGGFGEISTGGYEEIENTGISIYREYDLVRWDEVTGEYLTYEEYPFRDWENTAALNVASNVGLVAGAAVGTPTLAAAAPVTLTSDSTHYFSFRNTVAKLNTLREDCKLYTNLPGWSLIANRDSCQTFNAVRGNLLNEVANSTLIDPLDSQFWGYMWNAAQLDFGPSLNLAQLQENTQVSDEIEERLPVSAKLGLVSVVFGFVFGIPLGVLAAIYHNSPIDYVATFFAILGASTPNIVLAPILIIIFTVRFDLAPSPDPLVWRENASLLEWSPAYVGAMVLPVVALGTAMSAGIARLTRASLLQVLNEDYIRTARAKGLRERAVIYIHALKNSLIPVATILGPLLAAILTGTFVVERIFAIPGLGEAFIDGVGARDYTTIMAVTLLYSVFLIAGNILVDIIYTWLDPRIRFD
jgi:ABC-type dipeptide/oligopeptide/nickel transport system permease component